MITTKKLTRALLAASVLVPSCDDDGGKKAGGLEGGSAEGGGDADPSPGIDSGSPAVDSSPGVDSAVGVDSSTPVDSGSDVSMPALDSGSDVSVDATPDAMPDAGPDTADVWAPLVCPTADGDGGDGGDAGTNGAPRILSARLLADGQTLELTFTQSSCVPPTVDPSAFRLSLGNTQTYYSYYGGGTYYYTYYYEYSLPAIAALPEQPEGSSVEATLSTQIDIAALCTYSDGLYGNTGLYLHYRSPGPDIVNSTSGAPLTDLAAWWVDYSVDAGNPDAVDSQTTVAPEALWVDVNCDIDGGT